MLRCECGKTYNDPGEMTQLCNSCGAENPRDGKLFPLAGRRSALLCGSCCQLLQTHSIDELINSTALHHEQMAVTDELDTD